MARISSLLVELSAANGLFQSIQFGSVACVTARKFKSSRGWNSWILTCNILRRPIRILSVLKESHQNFNISPCYKFKYTLNWEYQPMWWEFPFLSSGNSSWAEEWFDWFMLFSVVSFSCLINLTAYSMFETPSEECLTIALYANYQFK